MFHNYRILEFTEKLLHNLFFEVEKNKKYKINKDYYANTIVILNKFFKRDESCTDVWRTKIFNIPVKLSKFKIEKRIKFDGQKYYFISPNYSCAMIQENENEIRDFQKIEKMTTLEINTLSRRVSMRRSRELYL